MSTTHPMLALRKKIVPRFIRTVRWLSILYLLIVALTAVSYPDVMPVAIVPWIMLYLFVLSMIVPENRYTLFRIML
ncbi:hypothetical protein [Bradyrhizobium sp. CCBAU 53421]|uniref:hypothetical protein n=1 Tax=Bradyrhizobium sp. CCBAU 53421 TaxID=1325120 RepID=UPI00188CA093|nr:hypothetical protein [Bradyrhizobium sp. CCBAU 53421]